MSLFQVEGWNLKTDKVAYGNANQKKTKTKTKTKTKAKKSAKHSNESKQIDDAQKHNENTEEVFEEAITNNDAENDATEKKSKKRKRKHNDKDIKEEPEQKQSHVEMPAKKLTPLQQKMMAKLSGSRFRWINEQLYTIPSKEALKLVTDQPQIFDEYHDGFRSQVQTWPENPVNVFVEQIRARSKRPVNAPGGLRGLKDKTIVIADMGCGEAQLALDVNKFFKSYNKSAKKNHLKKHIVHSFDLKKANERITVADIKNVPLEDNSCSIVVFCLALMGTNFLDFIKEAYRILAPDGELWISEIKSRFADGKGDEFVNALKLLGFFHKTTDDSNKMFTRFEFFKPSEDIIAERRAKLERRQKFIEVETEKEELETKRQKIAEGKWLLKPCIYKRR
ncbi:hypothetical protein TBLA_0B01850 [Henningerozyma blattae CBS 6284]|uniref:Ribosomal RNA-processing protein 8 n=1 Tax=Henningerozyma blattae (strain ATCC 34711 / CBS 6284 / DSM 70876 / NBRC 10599 / NRRL Y-10934 / UCD 77-7) TaxID=1071380 RepID=I2GY27_HENB6|nr:hypothetical protein TBLA_0B01850 [Tetrapisispora blattae CBS 6284]CCH59029.1 hypothetical protein TBLA_0B01850 [Tetrapisispora blattae CBS 6284]